jgi:hypothetical protein
MQPALLLWILFCIGGLTMNSQVKVWEGTMPLVVSDESPPDENPNFDTFAEVEDYPYTMRQDIRATETVHPWHTVYLENEYLSAPSFPNLVATSTPALTSSTQADVLRESLFQESHHRLPGRMVCLRRGIQLGLNQAMQQMGRTQPARRDDEAVSEPGKHAGTARARAGGGPPRDRPQRRSERSTCAPLPAAQRRRSAPPTAEIIPLQTQDKTGARSIPLGDVSTVVTQRPLSGRPALAGGSSSASPPPASTR